MKGVLRRGGMLAVCVMGLAMVLGGCSKDKKTAQLAQTENGELREKIATLEEALRQKDAQAAQNMPADGGWEGTSEPASRQTRVSTGGTRAFRDEGNGVSRATISGDVLFASGSADIKADAKKTLDKVASEIKREYPSGAIHVEGYTDSDPLVKTKNKWGNNEKLSQARADAVKKYLAAKGVKSSRIETMGFGAAKPKATKAQSRRVEIVVVQ
jgi:chemotaxis protein MotB